MRFVRERHQAPVGDYTALHRWSVEFPEQFWGALWDFCEVRAERRATQVLVDGNRLPGAKWFVDARLNYAENLLRLDGDTPAIVFRNERGQRRELSWRELRSEVARIADGLRRQGVGLRAAVWQGVPVEDQAHLEIHRRAPEHVGHGTLRRRFREVALVQRHADAEDEVDLDAGMAGGEAVEEAGAVLPFGGGVDHHAVLGCAGRAGRSGRRIRHRRA